MRTPLPALLLAVLGCGPQADPGDVCAPYGTGQEPCGQQLYFPSGIAIDPAGDVLYATSFNADLRYGGGAVHAIDLRRFECAVAFARTKRSPPGCAELLREITGEGGRSLGTLALGEKDPRSKAVRAARCPTVDPDPQSVGTLLDSDAACCRPDVDNPAIIECDEAPFINSAVKIGNFGRALRVQTRAPDRRRLWLAVRGEDSLAFVEVEKPEGAPAKLICRGAPSGRPGVLLDSCKEQRITVRYPAPGIDGTVGEATPIPPDPFDLQLDQGTDANGAPYARLLVAHLAGGEVTLIDAGVENPRSVGGMARPPDPRVVLDVAGGFFLPDGAGRRGAWSLAAQHPGTDSSLWYVTSRLNAQIGLFRVDEGRIALTPGFVVGGAVAGTFASGDDIRDVVFEPGGARAFFLQNRPPTLFTVDTRPVTMPGPKAGTPENRVVDIVNVCQGPVRLALRERRLYVVCFADTQVLVVDPDLAVIAGSIPVGQGAQEIAFNFGTGVDPAKEVPPDGERRAYVTNFTSSSVQVIDLRRGSDTEQRVVARIGTYSPPVNR